MDRHKMYLLVAFAAFFAGITLVSIGNYISISNMPSVEDIIADPGSIDWDAYFRKSDLGHNLSQIGYMIGLSGCILGVYCSVKISKKNKVSMWAIGWNLELNDERNRMINDKAKAKAFDITVMSCWAVSFFMLLLMDYMAMWLLLGIFLLGMGSFYIIRYIYKKKM